MTHHRFEVIRHATWSAGSARGHVWIVRQDWDHYHEAFYDEGPDLNDEGWAYYALYGSEPAVERHTARSRTCLSEEESVRQADAFFDSVTWT